MKNKEIIIKKVKKGLAVALVAITLSTGLTSCSSPVQEYASQEEIIETADFLDCDTTYLLKINEKFVRMKYNDGEPIYVCFDDSYSEEMKAMAIESLDYLFGVVGKINDKYHYKIVNKAEFALKGNKTKIYYTFGDDLETAEAYLESRYDSVQAKENDPTCYRYDLKLNMENIANEEELKYSLNHELLHAFGFGDVYSHSDSTTSTTDKHYGNTLMNPYIKYDIITPNDLACLISLYADENCDVAQMQHYLDKYETKFYKYYADLCKQKSGTTEEFDESEFVFETAIITEELDKTRHGYEYKVTVEDGKYLFEIYDYFNKSLIDSCNGEVTNQNGVLILKNVELKTGLRPNDSMSACYVGGYVQDLTLLTKDGKVELYNYHNNDAMSGQIKTLERSLAY